MDADVFVSVVVSLLILFAIPLIWAEATRRRFDTRLQKEGVLAQAEIVGLRVLSTHMETSPPRIVSYSYAITYVFVIDTADRGKVRYTAEHRISLPDTILTLLASGTSVRIRYLPSDPAICKLDDIVIAREEASAG